MYKEILFAPLHKSINFTVTKEKHYKTFTHVGIKIIVQEKQ